MPIGLLIDVFSVLCAIFALWKGGRAERSAALVVLANIAIGQLGRVVAPGADGMIRLVNDGLTALVLLGVTVRYGAMWMGGVMLFYAAQFAMHSYYLVTMRKTGDYLNALINNINFTGIIWCLVIGTVVAWRRRTVAARGLKAQAAPSARMDAPVPPV
ncbi:hypothetical protein [Phenylobacterium sp.]|uniref:hypothetical protein n=1 Tax=Phenylobacterium sp. TaxID=1871053 RepID=UPI0025E4A8F4|nr:hypothetical protein [Phenylobacterium sp.]